MQGAGIAVLTLLISFAIGIFIHYLGDGERKGNFLDLHVALDYVWLFKPSLIVLAIVVLSPFLMGVNNIIVKLSAFIVWLVSLILLFYILLRLYKWVKGDKNLFRLKYLSNFPKSSRDKIVSWKDYWATKISVDSRFIEKDFFIPFSNQVDEILKSNMQEEWALLPNLLEDFFSNIESRNKIFLLVFPEFFPKILEWNLILWKKQYSKFARGQENNEETKIDIKIFEVEQVVSQIIKYVTKEALTGNTGNAFSYFKYLKEHMDKNDSVKIIGQEHTYTYVEHLQVYEDCFNMIPKSKEAHNIWEHYFPMEWKITIDNLKKHIIPRVWLNRFINWAISRIRTDIKEWDKNLDEVSKEIFYNVDPITWAKILTFVLLPWSGSSRMKNAIESGQSFGYVGRIFASGWNDNTEVNFAKFQDEQFKNTIDLTTYIFGNIFTLDNLNKWQNELNQLNYQENSKEYRETKQWQELLSIIEKRIEEKNQKN